MLNPYLCLGLCKNSPLNPPMGDYSTLESPLWGVGDLTMEVNISKKEKYKICISLIGDKGVAQSTH